MKETRALHLTLIFLNLLQCRVFANRSKLEGKVVGGQYAHIREDPHAVCLFAVCSEDSERYFVCGSTVLNQRILLTAAHCFDSCSPGHEIQAIAGSTFAAKDESQGVIRKVEKWEVHNQYLAETLFHDIALSSLEKDLPLGRSIKRVIILPSFPSYASGTVAGWGATDDEGNRGVQLKSVPQKIWSPGECNRFDELMPGVICASSGREDSYPHTGDSGSGLVTRDFQIIGVVSYFVNNYSAVTFYTNVSYFKNWITCTANQLAC